MTLSKHLKRKLSHREGGKVSWIFKHHSVSIISCFYSAQGISQDPVICLLQAFITWQLTDTAAQFMKRLWFLINVHYFRAVTQEPEHIFTWKKYLILCDMVQVLCCKDHLNANDSPQKPMQPWSLSWTPFSFTIISFTCPLGGRRDLMSFLFSLHICS